MPTARSTPNIALIKYWGNRNDALRLPAGDSLAMTLNGPSVDVTAEIGNAFALTSIQADGAKKDLQEKDIERFRRHLLLCRNYLGTLGAQDALPDTIELTIESAIPSSIGLASSAAVFSATAKAYAAVIADRITLTDVQVSVLARLGSGSAARSIFGGYAALPAGSGDSIDSAQALQIAPEEHWMLHDIIIVPSHDAKKVGSTEGHAGAATSPKFAQRLKDLPARQQRCIAAIQQKDFAALREVSEEDCWNMHAVMESQDPPLHYLSDETRRITQEVETLRDSEHLDVLYTMDAGPTVHLFCTEEDRSRILAFAHQQQGCKVYEAKTGPGSHLI